MIHPNMPRPRSKPIRSLSIVIPACKEEENVCPLYGSFHRHVTAMVFHNGCSVSEIRIEHRERLGVPRAPDRDAAVSA